MPPGLLALVLVVALVAGAVAEPLASSPVIVALLLVGAFGPPAVARQLGRIVAAVIGLPARYGLLATRSRASTGRTYPPKPLSAR